MKRLSLLVAVLILFSAAAYAADGIDHGQTGTLNLNYFNPENDAHITWLINDIETYHLKPAINSIREGRLQQAYIDLDYLLLRFINHPQGLAFMGMLAKMMKKTAMPLPYYERALAIYPEYALTRAQFGDYLVEIGHVDEGIEQLKSAVDKDPKLVPANVWLAKAYTKKGNLALARQFQDQAKALGYKGPQLPQ
jgi:tetratricopeptide (TPR) repeat protein